MDFEARNEILAEVYAHYSLGEYADFADTFDVGLPLAWMKVNGIATPSDFGLEFIEAAWDGLCEYLGIDRHGEYEDFNAMIVFSLES